MLVGDPPDKKNHLIHRAMINLTSVLTEQLIKSLKKRDTWEIRFAIKEFKAHDVPDKYNLLNRAEQVIYSMCIQFMHLQDLFF